LKPILPGPRFVRGPVIEANGDGLPQVAGFRYLLDCTIPPDEVRARYPGLWKYFQGNCSGSRPKAGGYLRENGVMPTSGV